MKRSFRPADATKRALLAAAAALALLALGVCGCGAAGGEAIDGPGGGVRAGPQPPPAGASAGDRASPSAGAAGRSELPAEATLAQCLTHAAEHNAELRAAFHRWKAAVATIPQAKAPPDPRLTYTYYVQEVETRVGAQRQSLALAQTLPWFGKLSLRGDVAARAAEAEFQRLEAARLRLFHRVKDAYYEYYHLGRATAITDQSLRLLKLVEGEVRTRYKAAAASHPDLVRLQVELGKLADRLATLKDLKRPILARLNAALNQSPTAELAWPRRIARKKLGPRYAELLALMRKSNPELKALDLRAAADLRRVELARRDYFPDVTLGLTWIETNKSTAGRHPSDDGTDPLMAMVSVNVPVWREKLDAGVREARRRYRSSKLIRVQGANDLAARLQLAVFGFRDAKRKADLYRRTLTPKATQSLKVTQAAFRAGRAGFSDLIDAQRVLLEFELSYERALTDAAQRLAEIEMLVGRSLGAAGPPSAAGAAAGRADKEKTQ